MAPAALRRSVGNLPVELTSFVGRRRELAETKALLSDTRLLTLTGMGGVGKTRLARRIAAEVRRGLPDGVWQVELADLSEPALLVSTIATSMGLREQGGPWTNATLQENLADKHLLLLLDDCEHLIDACANTAAALLGTCPGLRILATSREPLAIDGEQTYSVPPLSVPAGEPRTYSAGLARYESVTLFVDRASAVLPGFAVRASNVQVIAHLCNRLDGVPLAIELAALRLRALSHEQILARLDDRDRLLTRGSRSAPLRQQTLGALVDWSHQLCSDEERLLWSSLSVFAGRFELDAVEEVCGGTPLTERSVVELIVGLVEKSVLLREEDELGVHYRMPQIIRAYALDRLSASMEETSVHRRHRDWYAALAARAYQEWVGPAQLSWFSRLRQEHANIRAALRFSLAEPGDAVYVVDIIAALIDYWIAFGFLSEGRHWLEQALRHLPEHGLARARALRAATILAMPQGDQSSAEAMLNESRALDQRGGNTAELSWIAYAGAHVALGRGDFATAIELYEEACSGFHVSGDTHGLVDALGGLVVTAAVSGQLDTYAARIDEFLAVTRPRGERYARSYVLWALGIAKWRLGENDGAAELAIESLTLRQPFGDPFGSGLCVEVLAWITARQGRAEKATELLGAARHILSAVDASVASLRFMLDDHERCESDLRKRLSGDAFEAAMHRGSTPSFDEIVALATDSKAPQRSAP